MPNSKKFCCERLKGLYIVKNEFKPNFRVISNSDDFIQLHEKRGLKISKELRFIITQGYTDVISSKKTDLLFINFCPFCGINLKSKYNSSYINEINHEW